MASNITVYTSYNKGLKTIKGNFPLYNSVPLEINCNLANTINNEVTIDLDEYADVLYLAVTDIHRDLQTLTIDVDKHAIDPNETGIITYDKVLVQVSSLSRALAHPKLVYATQKPRAPIYAKTTNTGIQLREDPPVPTPIFINSTPPPPPCQGTIPNCAGATILISYDAGKGASSANLYISQEIRNTGNLFATLFNPSGLYQLTGLMGDTTYYISIINNFGNKSRQLVVKTPAYAVYVYIPQYLNTYISL